MRSKERLDSVTWDWTKQALNDLAKIAKQAREASKAAPSLAEKTLCLDVESRAHQGMKTIALIFGMEGK